MMGEEAIRLELEERQILGPAAGWRAYRCRFVSAGRIDAADGGPGAFIIPARAIQSAVQKELFTGCACFVDHADWFQNASLRNIAGVVTSVEWNAETLSADGVIRLYAMPAGELMRELFDQILADGAAQQPTPDVGLSLVFWPEWEPRVEHDDPLVLNAFRKIESVDFCFGPAADGRVLEILSKQQKQQGERNMDERVEKVSSGEVIEEVKAADWLSAAREAAVKARLAQTDLPEEVIKELGGREYERPEDLELAIASVEALRATVVESSVVDVGGEPPRNVRLGLGRNSREQLEAAIDALIAGTGTADGVVPLTGVRELYHLLSGDYEMTGLFREDRVYLANVNSSTMAGMVANALNKRVVNIFAQYPQWWTPFVTIEDFASLQQVKWITLGGVGELPTVSEGAAYSELTWDDQTETADFVKKGGYLGITLEAIDKDDTGKLRAAPRALAQAAWLTLAKSISAIFTANSGTGPDMSDGNKLFDASNHGNLLTTALSHAAWIAVRTAMRKQTDLNSGERLGALTAPKFVLVPPDLENTALQVLASENVPGAANWDINIAAEGNERDARLQSARQRVVVIDLWTDTNDWAAVADPMLYPTIGLGFRYGRTPEIFSVASPTAGLMFTNDTMPVKVRFFFAVGPTDWRGLHKNNVS